MSKVPYIYLKYFVSKVLLLTSPRNLRKKCILAVYFDRKDILRVANKLLWNILDRLVKNVVCRIL